MDNVYSTKSSQVSARLVPVRAELTAAGRAKEGQSEVVGIPASMVEGVGCSHMTKPSYTSDAIAVGEYRKEWIGQCGIRTHALSDQCLKLAP